VFAFDLEGRLDVAAERGTGDRDLRPAGLRFVPRAAEQSADLVVLVLLRPVESRLPLLVLERRIDAGAQQLHGDLRIAVVRRELQGAPAVLVARSEIGLRGEDEADALEVPAIDGTDQGGETLDRGGGD